MKKKCAYEKYFLGNTGEMKHGVLTALCKCPEVQISAQLLTADITIWGFKMKIVAAYAPTATASDVVQYLVSSMKDYLKL